MGNYSSTYYLQQCSSLLEEALDANPDIVGLGVWSLRFWVQNWLSDNSTGISRLCSIRSAQIRGDDSGIFNEVSSGEHPHLFWP